MLLFCIFDPGGLLTVQLARTEVSTASINLDAFTMSESFMGIKESAVSVDLVFERDFEGCERSSGYGVSRQFLLSMFVPRVPLQD